MKFILLALGAIGMAAAQTWSGSGSNGSDGALNLNASTPGVSSGVYIFDPVALNLDTDADNVYHFTTITISGNIRVVFKANKTRRPGPVVFLASGAVLIAGRLDLSGEDGHVTTNNDSLRRISIPGPGGYPGGVGAKLAGTPPTGGMGPGGGRVIASTDTNNYFRGCPGGHTNPVIPSWCTAVGAPPAYGTNLLQPLVGGSGGSGSWGGRFSLGGAGGGAGGGAFRLASTVSIAFGSGLTGTTAQGCDSGQYYVISDGGAGGYEPGSQQRYAAAGAGGAIHLQAPIVAGCGIHAYARGGSMNDAAGSEGRIRFDATSLSGISASPPATTNALVDAPLPPNQPFLRVVSINGVNVPVSPAFDYASPDVLINSTSPVPIIIQANNIPVNTPVTLFFTTDTGADVSSVVNLTGTAASSTATANVTLPLGTARLIARAVW